MVRNRRQSRKNRSGSNWRKVGSVIVILIIVGMLVPVIFTGFR